MNRTMSGTILRNMPVVVCSKSYAKQMYGFKLVISDRFINVEGSRNYVAPGIITLK